MRNIGFPGHIIGWKVCMRIKNQQSGQMSERQTSLRWPREFGRAVVYLHNYSTSTPNRSWGICWRWTGTMQFQLAEEQSRSWDTHMTQFFCQRVSKASPDSCKQQALQWRSGVADQHHQNEIDETGQDARHEWYNFEWQAAGGSD